MHAGLAFRRIGQRWSRINHVLVSSACLKRSSLQLTLALLQLPESEPDLQVRLQWVVSAK